jgi:hypothetical protein
VKKRALDLDKIAAGLGGKRRGRVSATGGAWGALSMVAEVQARFRVPNRGGRATDPSWSERRLVPLAPETLQRLEALAQKIRQHGNVNVEPMQLAGLLLERTAQTMSDDEVERLLAARARAKSRRSVKASGKAR